MSLLTDLQAEITRLRLILKELGEDIVPREADRPYHTGEEAEIAHAIRLRVSDLIAEAQSAGAGDRPAGNSAGNSTTMGLPVPDHNHNRQPVEIAAGPPDAIQDNGAKL